MTEAEVRRLLSLDLPERLALVQVLWDSIRESEKSLTLTDDEKRFIDQRVQAYEENPNDLLSWEEARAHP